MELLSGSSLRPVLLRSTVSTGAVFAVLVMSLFQSWRDLPETIDRPVVHLDGAGSGGRTMPAWESAYSERYPGCVSMVLWPADEVPVALVTRSPSGRVDRIPVEALERPAPALADARAIGACR